MAITWTINTYFFLTQFSGSHFSRLLWTSLTSSATALNLNLWIKHWLQHAKTVSRHIRNTTNMTRGGWNMNTSEYQNLNVSSIFSRFCSFSSLPAWRQQGTALGLSGSVHVQTPCRGVAQLAARGALRDSTANVCTKTCSYPTWQAWKWHDIAGPLGPHSAFVPPTSFRSSKAIHLRRSAHEDRLLISTAVSGLLHWTESSYPTRRYFSSNSKESWENVGDFGHFQSSFIAVKCKMPCCITDFKSTEPRKTRFFGAWIAPSSSHSHKQQS